MTGAMSLAGLDVPVNSLILSVVGAALLLAIVLAVTSKKQSQDFPAPIVEYVADEVINKPLKYKLPKKALVTGGNGFVGRRIVNMLLDQGCEVTVFDIVQGFKDSRVKFLVGNLVKKEDVEKAVKGIDAIYHVAAPHASHPKKVQYEVNVVGTTNLLEAAAAAGVRSFVFTSSASVVYEGKDQSAADETTPIPTSGLDSYTQTKAQAEGLVLAANGKGGMKTVAIRPHGIFGPGDRQFFPVLVANARRGKTKYAIGDGKNVADFTFVGNVAHAHLLAAEKLDSVPEVAGQAFFVTNDAPLPFWDFLTRVLTGFGYKAPSVRLPAGLMYVVGTAMEGMASALSVMGVKFEPTFTKSRVQYLTTHHYYSIEKARRLLGYEPAWTQEESLAICFHSMPELRNPLAPKPKRARLVPGQPVPKYTKAMVAKHNNRDDAWIIVDGKVYDVTEYVDIHPGDDAILNYVGGDSTKGFRGPQHPSTAFDVLRQYHIGDLADE